MNIPFRQIHLDFHTASIIPDVGADFDVSDFVNTLKEAHVNSINIFAKCHHGMCYYPTKTGVMHPSLKFDLMGEMIEKLHANGIKCPIYFPLGWEENAALHEDWLEIGRDGVPGHKLPTESGYYRWKKLCLNNPDYLIFIKEQLKELVNNYDIDGFWFDIIFQQKCLCPVCRKEMSAMGMNPEDDLDVMKHDELVLQKLQRELNEYIASLGKNIPTFYNSSWLPDGGYKYEDAEAPGSGSCDTHRTGQFQVSGEFTISTRAKMQDHIEIESLPSGEWGYNHFPLFVNFHNRNNDYVVGMNGKFHLSWGDHGSLKNQEALEYECFRMIANGCACCVGDQLHPRGAMNKSAYKRIGRVFSEIEKLEPWLEGSIKTAETAIVLSTGFFEKDTASDEGAMRMLMELHIPFDFIQVTDRLDKYRLVILPDSVKIDDDFSNRLSEYLANGGHVIATCSSTDEKALGIKKIKDNEYCPSYMVIDGRDIFEHIDPLEYVCYERGVYVESSLPVKAFIGKPYFNRTADCFSSHRHFPFEKQTEYPAVLLNDKIGYCAFPVFRDYIINGNQVYRQVFEALLHSLLPRPVLLTDAPTCVETTVRSQPGRTLVHMLSYIAERRTRTIDIVDTRLPLYNVTLKLREDGITAVKCIRSNRELNYSIANGYCTVTIPEIDGYEIVEFRHD